jgi:hypothetical protein
VSSSISGSITICVAYFANFKIALLPQSILLPYLCNKVKGGYIVEDHIKLLVE